jgi:hypothetical protein
MQILPITNDKNQRFSTVLNGTELRFHFWYQKIGLGWYCDIETATGVSIITGARINSMSPILRSTLTDFTGDIIPIASVAEELGEEPWGNTHQLIYFTPEEIEEL